MTIFQRRARMLLVFCVLCLTLIIAPNLLRAQDNNTITVSGSGIVANALRALEPTAGTGATLNYTINGTNAGVSNFCAGGSDLVLTQRPLSSAEEAQCNATGIQFLELLIGYDAITFIAARENDYLTCIAQAELNTIFAPSAVGESINWDSVNPTYPASPISVILPAQTTLAFARLDELVAGDGARTDAQLVADDNAVISAVAANTNAIGVVRLSAVLALSAGENAGVKALDYNNADLNSCIAPSVETLADRSYTLGQRMFAYVNAASLTKPGLRELLTFVTSEAAAAPLTAEGFVGLSAESYTQAGEILTAGTTGRVFSKEVNAFAIPPDVSGAVNVGGAASLFPYTQSLTTAVTGTYAGLTITVKLDGIPAGARKLCNGEIEMIAVYGDLTDEQKTNCSANNLLPVSYNLGKQSAVLVANSSSAYLACLTKDQIVNTFGAKLPEVMPTMWNQISAEMPESKIVLFTPSQGDALADLVLIDSTGKSVPHRDDTEISNDPFYRAAAVANVEGGLTYMTWSDYERVVEANQERIQLVSVDVGAGCVAPSVETITDGTYPIARDVKLIVAQKSLATVPVQALLWYIFSDANYKLLQDADLTGVKFGDLPTLREGLQTAFNDAQTAAAAASALSAPPVTEGGTSTEEAISPTTTPQS